MKRCASKPWCWRTSAAPMRPRASASEGRAGRTVTVMAWPLCPREGAAHDGAGLLHQRVQVPLIAEALRVDLVHVLRAGRPRREPPVRRHHLEAADLRVVAR